jgi:DNA-binding NarL/FixJ family response regulator
MTVRVLIVDDHPMIREAFLDLFSVLPGLDPVGSAATAADALAALGRLHPDVMLVDLDLGADDGAELVGTIRERSTSRVILFTASTDPRELRRAVAVDPDGLLLKTVSLDHLAEAIRQVAAGERVIDRNIVGLVRSGSREDLVALSDRELEVLDAVVKGLTNREICRDLFIAQATVKRHIESIFEKLGVSDRASAVAEGFRQGLVS